MKTTFKIMSAAVLIALFSGCANAQTTASAGLSQSVFLAPQQRRAVYLNSLNTSGSAVNLHAALMRELANRGVVVVSSPQQADCVLNTNVVYMQKSSNKAANKGAAIGAGVGLAVGSHNHDGAGAVVAHGLLGAGVGALVGKMSEKITYEMRVDVNIKERVGSGVQEHNTQVFAEAKKTRLDASEAANLLAEQAARQIAQLF